jgi:hypothetical protein
VLPVVRVEALHGRAVRGVRRAWALPVAVAAGGGGNRAMMNERQVKSKAASVLETTVLRFFLLVALFGTAATFSGEAQQSGQTAAAQASPKAFATPKQASEALIHATEGFDQPALNEILGPDGEDLVSSEDPVRDKNAAAAFAEKAREKNEITPDPNDSNRAILSVGNDNWPLPIPLVKKGGKWSFDTKAGREEILFRRIGANELDAIQICRGYVEAQDEYALEKHDGDEVNQYAQHIISTPGKHDGLAWKNPDGSWGGPVGEGIAQAIEQGPALSRLLFQDFEGTRPRRVARPNGLRRGGGNDRRICPCRRTSGLPCHRRRDIHCQLRRGRLSERPRPGHAQHIQNHGALQPRQDLAAYRRQLVTFSVLHDGLKES